MDEQPQNRTKPGDAKRQPDGRFGAGNNANPGGRPRRFALLHAALESASTPEQVCEVVDKLRELALAGDVSAAKVYLDRVMGPPTDPRQYDELFRDAPQEVLEWFANTVGGR